MSSVKSDNEFAILSHQLAATSLNVEPYRVDDATLHYSPALKFSIDSDYCAKILIFK